MDPYLRPTTLTQGRVLFEPGEEITHLHFPRSGAVSLVLVMGDGNLVETLMVGREGVTDAGSYAGPRRATSRAIAQLPGEALRIEAGRLREFAAERPGVRLVLERYAAGLIGELEQTAACNAIHRLEQRLARWLLRSHDRADADVLPLTQEYLSEMLGAQRTTVTQVAGVLQRAGAIDYRRGRITVLDRATLERLSCECYSAAAGSERGSLAA
jgi:CRP-like cAMP-binding protein